MLGIIRKIQNYFADQVDVQAALADQAAHDGKDFSPLHGVPIEALMNKELGRAYGVTDGMAKVYGIGRSRV